MSEQQQTVDAGARRVPTSEPVIDLIAGRWSPRAFSDATVSDATLAAGLEAARLAPSAYNSQPWRFIVGRRGGHVFDRILAHLIPFNQGWARDAAALVLNVAVIEAEGRKAPLALYDLGLAVQSLVLQLQASDVASHQISGIDPDALDSEFGLGAGELAGLHAVTVTVIGVPGDPAQLDAGTRERETAPRERLPLDELVLLAD